MTRTGTAPARPSAGWDPATRRLGDPEQTSYAHDAVDRLVGVLYPGGAASLYGLDARARGKQTAERLIGACEGGCK